MAAPSLALLGSSLPDILSLPSAGIKPPGPFWAGRGAGSQGVGGSQLRGQLTSTTALISLPYFALHTTLHLQFQKSLLLPLPSLLRIQLGNQVGPQLSPLQF